MSDRFDFEDGRGGPLRQLDVAKPVYYIPRDDLVREVMVPAFQITEATRAMMGFFDSRSLAQLAPGIAGAFASGAGFKFLCSPRLSEEDAASIERAVVDPQSVLEETFMFMLDEARISEAALVRYHHQCLAFLLASGRLEIRLVLMNGQGLFHPKTWIFTAGGESVVVHGSSNATRPGLLYNYEHLTVERPWRGEDSRQRVESFIASFEGLWTGQDEECLTFELSEAVRGRLISSTSSHSPPTLDEFWSAWEEDVEAGFVPPLPVGREVQRGPTSKSLRIPDGIEWETGPFRHQGEAVRAWEANHGRGVLAMATGAGKTIAALIAAARLQRERSPLAVVVAAPYIPLIEQWMRDVRDFGVEPVPIAKLTGRSRHQRVHQALQALSLGMSKVEVLVITHRYLNDEAFRHLIRDLDPRVTTLLVADEVHNLGAEGFISNPPNEFQFRLGLSATPERQYDQDGTDALFAYFGDPVFEFGLDKALGVCLVPYDYYIHVVELSGDEFEEWLRLTERLRRMGVLQDEPDGESIDAEVKKLLIARRAIIENASGKLSVLAELMRRKRSDSMKHVLVYASDKRPQHIIEVNRLLTQDLGLIARQVTASETSNRKKVEEILEAFEEGEIQVLTAKRVLDEGVNIPQVQEAFILASSTVERQWVQRRGRLLRLHPGKEKAILHDFVVLPPPGSGAAGESIRRSERLRARSFATLAANSDEALEYVGRL